MTTHNNVAGTYRAIIKRTKARVDRLIENGQQKQRHLITWNKKRRDAVARVTEENKRLGLVHTPRAKPFIKKRHQSSAPVTLAKLNLPE